jgi:hypothetical protein
MKYVFTTLCSSLILFAVSCNTESKNYVKKTIPLSGYDRIEKDSIKRYTELTILNIYPAKLECTYSEKYANLYIAQQFDGKVIYIFELCSKVPEFAYDTTGRTLPIIFPDDILKERQTIVTIFVPEDFRLPEGARYLFTKLGVLDES